MKEKRSDRASASFWKRRGMEEEEPLIKCILKNESLIHKRVKV